MVQYKRTLADTVKQLDKSFPVILITGPRQVGKTTLLSMCANSQRQYVSLDNLRTRAMAIDEPELFMQSYPPPIIIDEIQYAPKLFNYIKIKVDKTNKNGLYWLTGSQKFHLMKGIQESLAGRVAILDLLGLSQSELHRNNIKSKPFIPTTTWINNAKKNIKPLSLKTIFKTIWLGGFPKIYQNNIKNRNIFYKSYIQTYIKRDIKDILNITNENLFYKFLTCVAARTSQLLNYADLARDIGIDNKTIKSWISVLETSGLIYLLYPYYNNITKRIIKTPKIYFLDTGLCAYITKWPTAEALEVGAMSGAILETYIFSEILKSYWHNGEEPYFYYYRDTDQKEIDLLIESGDTLYPVEFKKTASPTPSSIKNFKVLSRLNKTISQGAVICFVEEALPITKEVMAMPVGYL